MSNKKMSRKDLLALLLAIIDNPETPESAKYDELRTIIVDEFNK